MVPRQACEDANSLGLAGDTGKRVRVARLHEFM